MLKHVLAIHNVPLHLKEYGDPTCWISSNYYQYKVKQEEWPYDFATQNKQASA